jgi:hypothetical protein
MLRIVFQNLLINSAHAMNGKGRIRVSVGSMDSPCQITFCVYRRALDDTRWFNALANVSCTI